MKIREYKIVQDMEGFPIRKNFLEIPKVFREDFNYTITTGKIEIFVKKECVLSIKENLVYVSAAAFYFLDAVNLLLHLLGADLILIREGRTGYIKEINR